MPLTIASISMSLDGYIAGEKISNDNPLGIGGTRLHDWIFKNHSEADKIIMSEMSDSSGAVIVGGRTYHTAIDKAWEGRSPFTVPALVLTHHTPEVEVEGFIYHNDGINKIIHEAKIIAGDMNVWAMGGADIIQQCINAKLLDVIQITVVNILMGHGTRLFDNLVHKETELILMRQVLSEGVTHLKYKIEY